MTGFGVLVVSGTGTDVGKTITTAALAVCAARRGSVVVVKPAQTGVGPDEPGDLAVVTRLSGVTEVLEFARYPDPLSPHQAARLATRPELPFAGTVRAIDDLAGRFDTVLVEGAGGLLVPFDRDRRWTLVELAQDLDAPVMIVTAAGLGTLNHTALTVAHLEEQGVGLAGIVIGSWPAEPDLAARANLVDLAAMCPQRRLAGALPAGLGAVRDFRRRAPAAIGPAWGGTFDAGEFVARNMR